MSSVAFIAILIAAFTFASCSSGTKPADIERVKAELVVLERRLIMAVQRKDTETLNELWDDEYFGTAPNGRTVTKADLMAAVKDGVIEIESIEPDDLYVRVYGDVAIMTGRAEVKAKVVDEEVVTSVRGTGIFVNRNGKWKIGGVHVGPNDPDRPLGGVTQSVSNSQ